MMHLFYARSRQYCSDARGQRRTRPAVALMRRSERGSIELDVSAEREATVIIRLP
ncbi:hypothetical protein ACFL34_02250 [Candidatus Sumerlaeota bacterium]